nr:immunoglobulin light chain junction region [Macaca mulatta]
DYYCSSYTSRSAWVF